jgi:t-SNARE complex subunit (syntaxin)
MQLLMVDNELDFNEAMIGQREQEIQEIEHGITEINEIFKDLGNMVYEQSSLLGKENSTTDPILENSRMTGSDYDRMVEMLSPSLTLGFFSCRLDRVQCHTHCYEHTSCD